MKTVAALYVLTAIALPAAAQDHTLDLAEDPNPDEEVVFTITVPYELSDVDEMVTTFGLHCSISACLPRNNGTGAFNCRNFVENVGTDITGTPVSADGYRDVSGEISIDIAVPYEQVQSMRLPGARANYKCDPRMGIGGVRLGVRNVGGDEVDNLSAPIWSRGTGNGRVRGDIVLPGPPDGKPVQANEDIDTSVIPPRDPALPTSPLFPKKGD